MDFKTAIRRLIPYIFIVALVFTGCRKEDQETVVHVRCVMPHNNQPIKGCKVIITEGKMNEGFFNSELDPIQQFTGVTDENGVATIRFHYKKKNKFQYMLSKDYSGIEPPNGMTDLNIKLPQGWTDYLDKKQFEFNFEFRVFGFCGIHEVFNNINCLNSNDSIQITPINISEWFWNPFPNETYHFTRHGCGVMSDMTSENFNLNSGKMVYRSKIYRNGVETIQWDTVVLYPGVINEAIIEY